MSEVTADSEFAVIEGDNHAAECLICGKPATVLVVTERHDGLVNGPTYCWVHFATLAARVTGIAS